MRAEIFREEPASSLAGDEIKITAHTAKAVQSASAGCGLGKAHCDRGSETREGTLLKLLIHSGSALMKKKITAIIGMILMILAALPVQAAEAAGGYGAGKVSDVSAGITVSAYNADTFQKLGNGWHYIYGNWFYVRGGKAATGWVKDNGKWYFCNKEGEMQTGWVKVDGKWYYLNTGGAMKTGWLKDGGKKYYLSANGAMKTGWAKIKGKWYYFNDSGVMKTGWLKKEGRVYYLDSDGQLKTGWLKLKGKAYYLLKNGERATGWIELGGKKYFFDSNGVLNVKKTREAAAAQEEVKSDTAQTDPAAATESSSTESKAADSNKTKGEMIAEYALQFVGNPYVYGGCSLTEGTDCSGFVMLIYRHFGVTLPHYDAAIRVLGKKVNSLSEAKAGDVICYYGHVAIYLGDGRIVHASNSRDGIKISERADYRTISSIRRFFD